jgi:hypothetical protein
MDQNNLNDLHKQAHDFELHKIVKLTHFSKKFKKQIEHIKLKCQVFCTTSTILIRL